MNSQEYEVTAFDKSDFQDQNGNYWCSAIFLGVGEPVKWVVKDPTTVSVGQKVYGRITDETSKAGKAYRRFRREKKPDTTYTPVNDKPTEEYWADKQAQIKAQWAIGQGVHLYIAQMQSLADKDIDISDIEFIEAQARELFSMVDRIKAPAEGSDNETSTHN